MDWTQTLTIIGTMAGLVFFIRREHREDLQIMDANHREDIRNMDDKWTKLFSLFVEKFKG